MLSRNANIIQIRRVIKVIKMKKIKISLVFLAFMLVLGVNSAFSQTDSLKKVDPEKIYTFAECDEQVSFDGGTTALNEWVAKNMVYPKKARRKGIQGRIVMGFVVEKDGSMTNVKVLNTVDPLLSDEVFRMMKEMPKWKPAKIKGQPVRSSFTCPFSFKLH
jgi:periplasmic protein TonB